MDALEPAIASDQPAQAPPSPDATIDASAAPVSATDDVGTDVRVVEVQPGNSLSDLITAVYGAYDPRFVPRIQAMNPQLKNPNYIVAGDRLRFPNQGNVAPTQQPGSPR
jgi:nucleoid-associated protein YgaU